MSPLARTLSSLFGLTSAGTGIDLTKVADRRRQPRFKVELALQWPGGTAMVRDINTEGVQFETNHPIQVHQKMKFTIVVPDENGLKCFHALCDSEIRWTAPSTIKPHKLNVGASFSINKFIEVPRAA